MFTSILDQVDAFHTVEECRLHRIFRGLPNCNPKEPAGAGARDARRLLRRLSSRILQPLVELVHGQLSLSAFLHLRARQLAPGVERIRGVLPDLRAGKALLVFAPVVVEQRVVLLALRPSRDRADILAGAPALVDHAVAILRRRAPLDRKVPPAVLAAAQAVEMCREKV